MIAHSSNIFGICTCPRSLDHTLQTNCKISDGAARSTWRPVVDEVYERAKELFERGLSVRQVEKQLGISKSAAGRLRQQWQAEANDEDEEEDKEETA